MSKPRRKLVLSTMHHGRAPPETSRTIQISLRDQHSPRPTRRRLPQFQHPTKSPSSATPTLGTGSTRLKRSSLPWYENNMPRPMPYTTRVLHSTGIGIDYYSTQLEILTT
ncbi:MAG TPA: hypothetical protein VGO47_06840 [Chlamydiales bacterium]|nr:hypothetical protein [Chlamydiales bacterium]